MDQTYEELRLQRNARLQRAPYMRAWSKVLDYGHRSLLLVLAALFLVRSAGQAVFGALQYVVLAPYAALACLVFRVWATKKQVCGQDLDVGRVYAAFWAGEPLVLGTGLESFFLGLGERQGAQGGTQVQVAHEHRQLALLDTLDADSATLSKQQANALKRLANHLKREKKREATVKSKRRFRRSVRARREGEPAGGPSMALTMAPALVPALATATLPRRRFFKKRR